MTDTRNSYLEEVLQQQQNVERQMRARKVASSLDAAPAMAMAPQIGGGGDVQTGPSIELRFSGFWRFQTVVVPPNVWVVHTRRGNPSPLHVGIGVSFRYDPYTDAFLVAPATMQTLAISAKCICKERQGILVQAYVQWIIDDFEAAYKKLDFSDVSDPMRIVNLQLREQAEASIKDTVAMMSIDDVLSDKRPIIEELTARLRSVAEGQGIKIVQVQIKEAVVSSTRLWDNMQKTFREEQARIARMAELERERAVNEREIKDQLEMEQARILSASQTEQLRRAQEVEQLTSRAALEEERVRAELQQIHAQAQLDEASDAASAASAKRAAAAAQLVLEADVARERMYLAVEGERRALDNQSTPARVQEQLMRALPELLEKLPKPTHSEVIHIGGDADGGLLALTSFVKGLKRLLSNQAEP
jgi:flotillin